MQKHKCNTCTGPEKRPGCHDHCEAYLSIKAANDAEKRAGRGRVEAYRYTMEQTSKNANHNCKKKKQGRLTYSRKG